jgi:hypothetical protein
MMNALKLTIRVFCIVPFVTGAFDLIDGVRLMKSAGLPLIDGIEHPVLDSQIKFWGAIWFGYGIILWRTSSRLRDDADLFRILYGILFLSGLGRLASALRLGLPGPQLTVAMGLELAGPVAALIAHNAGLARPDGREAT